MKFNIPNANVKYDPAAKEDIGLGVFSHLARYIHMHVNNKIRNYKHYES